MLSSNPLEARDPEVASRFAATVCFVAGGLSGAMTIFVRQEIHHGMQLPLVGASVAIMIVGLLVLTSNDPLRRWLLLIVPLLGIGTILGLTLGTNDASASGQVFLCAPVLYAASQLHKEAAWFVCACSIAADAAITFTLLPVDRAINDFIFVGAAIVMTTWLLVKAGERNDALVNELRAQAAVDPLTGLVTRRVLDRAAHSVLSSSDSDGGTALIVLDVDKFKTINDTWGHPVGDAVLIHIADVLRTHFRPDTVLSRLGGDELALLLPGCPYDVAVDRAESLVEAIRDSPLVLASGEEVQLSVSLGVAHAPRHARELRELYAVADASLYDAKRRGRGCVGHEVTRPREEAAGV